MTLRKTVIMCVMLSCLLVPLVRADALISAVLYDPEGTENGHEWIELYNPGDRNISLQDYALETSDSADSGGWDLVWNGSGHELGPHEYFLVGGDSVTPKPDHIVSFTLTNTGDACRLLHGAETVQVMGWNEPGHEEYYWGEPIPDAEEGQALVRRKEDGDYISTSDNAADFTRRAYVPHTLQGYSQWHMRLQVEVLRQQIDIVNMSLPDEDTTREGVQIYPHPGEKREVPLDIEVNSTTECDQLDAHARFRKEQDIMRDMVYQGDCSFRTHLPLRFDDPPGNYTIELNVSGDYNSNMSTIEFRYMPLAAFSMNAESLSLGAIHEKGAVTGDRDPNSSAPTVHNLGNVKMDLGLLPTRFSSGEDNIDISRLHYTIESAEQKVEGNCSLQMSTAEIGLSPDELAAFSLSLTVPPSAEAGTYNAQLALMGLRTS